MAKEELAAMLRVYCIDPDTNKFNLSLGISDERAKELVDKAKSIWETEVTISGALEKVSAIVKNANELAYVSFHQGDNRGVGKVEHVITRLLDNPLLAADVLTEMQNLGMLVEKKEEKENSSSELLIDEEQEVPIAYVKSTMKTPNHPGTF